MSDRRRWGWWIAGMLSIAISGGGYAWCVSLTHEWILTGMCWWGLMASIGLLSSAYIDSKPQ